jgi:uncharacterized protein YyaL (SSP411 family)
VKNPSCENVDQRLVWDEEKLTSLYKIIIPQEEPKQETLEEAAKKYAEEENSCYTNDYYGFIKGAKWQQEQILQFLYSEITERRDYSASKMCEKVVEFIKQNQKEITNE